MDNQSIEKKLDMVINLLVGVMGAIAALAVLYSGDQQGGVWQDRSVLLAAGTYFVTTMFLQKLVKS